eukprot:10356450-Lingulodinium_polyedra.AAC.1
MASIQLCGLRIDAAALHAPHSGHPEEVVKAWWAETTRAIAAARAPGARLVICADANATMGSVQSQAVGSWQAETQGFTGDCFHALLLELGLALPATHEEHYAGDNVGTWYAPRGGSKRLDYVAVQQDCLAFGAQSGPCLAVDLALQRVDHVC